MATFQLDDCTKRSEELLRETRKIFEEYEDLNLKTDALPETMQPSDGKIKLVFVGQYSAGKSSIIKMLSGIDTVIGADEKKAAEWFKRLEKSGDGSTMCIAGYSTCKEFRASR